MSTTHFLANENFPLASIHRLRAAGYDVSAIAEASPGITDVEVLQLATAEARIILTFDRDYGEPIYRLRLPPPPGLVFLRFVPATPEEPAETIFHLLSLSMTMEGKFTVLTRDQARQRQLPLSLDS